MAPRRLFPSHSITLHSANRFAPLTDLPDLKPLTLSPPPTPAPPLPPSKITLLPPELLLLIASYLPRGPLNALIRSHRRFHLLLNQTLYRRGIFSLHYYTPQPPAPNFCKPLEISQSTLYGPSPFLDPQIPGHDSCLSILGWAILHGPPGTLKWFLYYGLSVNTRFAHWWGDMYHVPLLIVAVFHEREKVVRLLLKSGARVNDTDERGWTAMRYCREVCGTRRGVERGYVMFPTMGCTETRVWRLLRGRRAW
ncbi:hypothetical protein BDD12DRAFT_888878 [Trichophaea hybrida]|nr:hypothetical protein BDD12DRAFT_888878 [Trichophaea hybrida]